MRMAQRRKKSNKNRWIQGAIKNPGALRRSLKVKKGQKIPASKLRTAAKKGGKTGQRARLALTLRKVNSGSKKRSTKKRRR
jgi:hypothetical protein